jgi:hypothetical protein
VWGSFDIGVLCKKPIKLMTVKRNAPKNFGSSALRHSVGGYGDRQEQCLTSPLHSSIVMHVDKDQLQWEPNNLEGNSTSE